MILKLQIQGRTTMQIHGFLQFQNSLIIKYYVEYTNTLQSAVHRVI